MRRNCIGMVFTCGVLVAQPGAAAQPSDLHASAPAEGMDEVLVRGTRLKELKAAIAEAEDRFYERYNELNKVDDYDIECAMDTHTGTKIPQRRCFTRLQMGARSQHALETLQMFQQQVSGPTGHPGTPPNTDPDAVWLAHFDEYRENMLFLLKVNPELRRLARASEDAQKRYDAEYRRRLKGRIILVE